MTIPPGAPIILVIKSGGVSPEIVCLEYGFASFAGEEPPVRAMLFFVARICHLFGFY